MNIRFAGMLIAVGISFATVLIPVAALALGSVGLDVGALGLMGAPLAGLLAFWLTPTVVRGSWRWAAGVGLMMGTAIAYLGVLESGYLSLIAALAGTDPSTGFRDDVFGSIFIAMIGLPFGTFALPITVPCGLAWALLVRGLLRRVPGATSVGPTELGTSHVVILLGAVALGAALVPVAR